MKNWDLSPFWQQLRQLFTEEYFLTVFCGFVVVAISIKFYRFLRGISPALIPVVFVLMIFIILIHWTQTRSEPAFMKPVVDWLARFVPTPTYWR